MMWTPRLGAVIALAILAGCRPHGGDGGSGSNSGSGTTVGSSPGSSAGSSTGERPGSAAAPCTASATVQDVVAPVAGPLGGAALDETSVYVAGHFDNGIHVERFPRGGGAGTPLANAALAGDTLDLPVIVGDSVYFVGASSGKVYKVPKAGGAATYTSIAEGYDFMALRKLASDGESLYVVGYRGRDAVVERIALAGGAPQRIATLPTGQWNLAIAGPDLWLSGGYINTGGIRRVAKTGGTLETVVPQKMCLSGLAITADAIVCADLDGIHKIPRAGGAATELYHPTAPIDGLGNMIVSPDAAVAYVSDAHGDGNARRSDIIRVDTATGAQTTIACGLTPTHQLALGPHALAWTTAFVAVTGKSGVQLMAL